jgi:hypothetical protein
MFGSPARDLVLLGGLFRLWVRFKDIHTIAHGLSVHSTKVYVIGEANEEDYWHTGGA